MNTFLYKFFHNETNDRTEKGLVKIPKDTSEWPEKWKKIAYKKYDLLKPIALPQAGGFLFEKILSKRRSSEGYISGNSLTLEKIASILQCGYGLQSGGQKEGREENRAVPSAGKLYPLEIYVFLFKDIEGCKSGIYHYGVKAHALEPVLYTQFSSERIRKFSPEQEWIEDINGIICITSIFDRTVDKYGSRGYRYILLEAGHVAQNMLLAGTENNVNIVPIGGIEEREIEKVIGLNSSEERAVYTLFL